MLLSLVSILLIWWSNSICLKVLRLNNKTGSKPLAWYCTGMLPRCLFHTLINLICLPPGIDCTFSISQLHLRVEYSINNFIAVVSLLRLWYCVCLLQHYSKWMNTLAITRPGVYASKSEYAYALNSHLRHNSYIFISVTLLISTLLLGAVLKIFERNTNRRHNGFEYIWNSFWVVILTMTTVGYGDIYPVTHFGRLTTMIACIVGTFILTLLVSALNSALELNPQEQVASNAYETKCNVRKHLKKDAEYILANYLRMTVLRKRRLQTADKIKKRSVSLL